GSVCVRLVDPPGRRDHGRQRPDRGARSSSLEGQAPMSGPRPEPAWDVVVIGAGHNALIAATYIARAGLRTLLLERRDRVGGAADTTKLAKGIRVPTLAHTVGRLRPSVQKDLDLKRHGLSLVAPDVRVFAPLPDGSAITLLGDAEKPAVGFRLGGDVRARDAEAYAPFDKRIRRLGRFLDTIGRSTPPDIESPGLGDALSALRLGSSFKALGRDGSRHHLR